MSGQEHDSVHAPPGSTWLHSREWQSGHPRRPRHPLCKVSLPEQPSQLSLTSVYVRNTRNRICTRCCTQNFTEPWSPAACLAENLLTTPSHRPSVLHKVALPKNSPSFQRLLPGSGLPISPFSEVLLLAHACLRPVTCSLHLGSLPSHMSRPHHAVPLPSPRPRLLHLLLLLPGRSHITSGSTRARRSFSQVFQTSRKSCPARRSVCK